MSHVGSEFGMLMMVGIGSRVYVPCGLAFDFETEGGVCRVT
jgi:hypothetical protein